MSLGRTIGEHLSSTLPYGDVVSHDARVLLREFRGLPLLSAALACYLLDRGLRFRR
ncbi:hypothetical protein GCM10022214_61220 [Actinomadura miaoliensis]|uniref:Uncharacterized protein n=1 Tax=Actinomadura miaoliensis TaxID=430685 RepID=A0ABP7WNL8_9ACTN